jgi:hypothetical protein
METSASDRVKSIQSLDIIPVRVVCLPANDENRMMVEPT